MYALKKRIFVWSVMTLKLDLQISVNVTTFPWIKGTMWVKYESDLRKGSKDMVWTRIFHIILLWPHLTLKNGSRSLHTLYSKALFMWSMSQIGLSEKYICSEQRIFAWSNMTLTLNLQTSFKVTAHPLTIDNLWVKNEQYWTKGREDMPRIRILYKILLWP